MKHFSLFAAHGIEHSRACAERAKLRRREDRRILRTRDAAPKNGVTVLFQ